MRTAVSARARRSVLGPTVYGLAVVGLRIAVGVALLAAAYLLFGLFSGQLREFASIKGPDQARILSNLSLAQSLLTISLVAASVLGAYIYFGIETTGYILALSGAFLYAGIPFLFSFLTGTVDFGSNRAVAQAMAAFPVSGLVPLIVGGLLMARDIVLKLIDLVRNRPLQRDLLQYGGDAAVEAAPRPVRLGLLAKCWEGPFCRDFVRPYCPIFIAKKACWRVKRGCYCEEDIVSAATMKMSGMQLQMAPDARYNFANSSTPTRRKPELTPGQKRERCRHCVIYNEHQREKYRKLLPLVFVGIFALALIFSPQLRLLLRHGLAGVEVVMGRLSFGETEGGISFRFGRPSATVEWIFIAAFSVMALSKALETLEWAIFKLKI